MKGHTLLRLALGILFVVVMLVTVPESRYVMLAVLVFSIPIGIVVALILRFYHNRRPLKEDEVENKRPLGLDV